MERLYFNFVDNEYGTEPRVQVLINDVETLKLYYFAGDEWAEELTDGDSKLPMAIKLELETDTFGLIERNFLIVQNTQAGGQSGG